MLMIIIMMMIIIIIIIINIIIKTLHFSNNNPQYSYKLCDTYLITSECEKYLVVILIQNYR